VARKVIILDLLNSNRSSLGVMKSVYVDERLQGAMDVCIKDALIIQRKMLLLWPGFSVCRKTPLNRRAPDFGTPPSCTASSRERCETPGLVSVKMVVPQRTP
jgi:hypothetical protein